MSLTLGQRIALAQYTDDTIPDLPWELILIAIFKGEVEVDHVYLHFPVQIVVQQIEQLAKMVDRLVPQAD